MLRHDIEQQYGLRIVKWQTVKDVVCLHTSKGKRYCLKSFCVPAEDVRFIIRVIRHLRHTGFHQAPKIYATQTGSRILTRGTTHYIVTDWVSGSSPDFTDSTELSLGVKTLAQFHRYAEGMSSAGVPNDRNRVLELGAHIDSFQETLLMGQRVSTSGVNFSPLVALCDRARQHLQISSVQSAIVHEQEKRAFMHGDFNYPNLVRDRARRIHLIDFDNTALHVRMMDLAHILHRNVGWSGEKALRLIERYSRARPLSKEDAQLLYVLLILPYPIVRFLRQYPAKPGRVVKILPSEIQLSQYLQTLQALL